ncbi:putative alpha-L-glutamate ligase 1 [Frankliniella fusca]|uniref:Alpha-L-glutamate ligase 1 n=1 Tax=Frankliniella fusca TaxID=407009 RepID=A0AAE1HMI7_9NEOP|nr:putative alpha-L-glutamate ligase 1 [Frankliniella fusca]
MSAPLCPTALPYPVPVPVPAPVQSQFLSLSPSQLQFPSLFLSLSLFVPVSVLVLVRVPAARSIPHRHFGLKHCHLGVLLIAEYGSFRLECDCLPNKKSAAGELNGAQRPAIHLGSSSSSSEQLSAQSARDRLARSSPEERSTQHRAAQRSAAPGRSAPQCSAGRGRARSAHPSAPGAAMFRITIDWRRVYQGPLRSGTHGAHGTRTAWHTSCDQTTDQPAASEDRSRLSVLVAPTAMPYAGHGSAP